MCILGAWIGKVAATATGKGAGHRNGDNRLLERCVNHSIEILDADMRTLHQRMAPVDRHERIVHDEKRASLLCRAREGTEVGRAKLRTPHRRDEPEQAIGSHSRRMGIRGGRAFRHEPRASASSACGMVPACTKASQVSSSTTETFCHGWTSRQRSSNVSP